MRHFRNPMNADQLFARCPTCKTVFRTGESQLAMRSGRVRCGQCRMVFDGRSHLVEVAFDEAVPDENAAVPAPPIHASSRPEAAAEPAITAQAHDFPTPDEPALGEPVLGRPLATNANDSDATTLQEPTLDTTAADIAVSTPIEVPTSPTPASPTTPFPDINPDPLGLEALLPTLQRDPPNISGPPTVTRTRANREPAPAFDQGPATIASANKSSPLGSDTVTLASQPAAWTAQPMIADRPDHVVMPAWKGPATLPKGGARWAYGSLSVVLLFALAAQGLFWYRNVLAANFPVLRPRLATACMMVGCRIEPLRSRDEIVIESHDLQADPAHQGLLILQTTLRNQARHALAFPHLELQLDDGAGKPIVRRVFAPLDYAGGAADFSTGIPGNSEWNVKLFLDASSVSAGSYHLYHFYP